MSPPAHSPFPALLSFQLNVTSTKESQTLVTASEKEELLQYLLEAGIDPDTFPTNRELVIQELMTFHVIDKRRLQLNDIAKGIYCITIIHNM